MATFISIANQKGGVGKSQITIMLASAIANLPTKLKVLVVDTDKQQSIFRMRGFDRQAYNGNFPTVAFDCLSMAAQEFSAQMDEFDDNYDVVFVDIAGKMDNNIAPEHQEVTPVLMVADLVLVPFLAGNHNMNSSSEFIAFVMKIKAFRDSDTVLSQRPVSVGVFGNRISKDTLSSDALSEMWTLKHVYPSLVILKTHLKDSNVFKTADTVTNLNVKSKLPAKVNFSAFFNEILETFEI